MYVKEKYKKAIADSIGLIEHEANCRGSDELFDLVRTLDELLEKMKNEIDKRKSK